MHTHTETRYSILASGPRPATGREVEIVKHLLGRLVELQQQTPDQLDTAATYSVFQALEAIRLSEVARADPEWAQQSEVLRGRWVELGAKGSVRARLVV
jgi:hypothetical protein